MGVADADGHVLVSRLSHHSDFFSEFKNTTTTPLNTPPPMGAYDTGILH